MAGAIVVLAMVAAALLRRRSCDVPTQSRHQVPVQLDRMDFPSPDTPWLVVVFSSATCPPCADMVAKSQVLTSDEVGVCEVEFGANRELHRRYAIDSVPLVVIADRDGAVRRSYLGSVSATDLWAAVAECRDPGSIGRGGCS